jgi:hypothetical protein
LALADGGRVVRVRHVAEAVAQQEVVLDKTKQNKCYLIFEINITPWNTVDSYLSCSFLNFHENVVFDL